MDKELLKKFVRNQCTSDEVDAVFDWIRQTDRLSGETLLKDYWDEIKLTDSMDEVLVRQRLDRIHHQINLNQAEQMDSAIPRFFTGKKVLSRPTGFESCSYPVNTGYNIIDLYPSFPIRTRPNIRIYTT
ncbi:MAG: hypothetical protein AB2L24_14580 [Mangrovibacterium sp.]